MSDDPLNLGKLPPREPPADLWNVIEARLDVQAQQADAESQASVQGHANSSRPRWLPMALAAAVSVFAIGLVVILANAPDVQPSSQSMLADSSTSTEAAALSEADHSTVELELAQTASAVLETRLRQVSNGVVAADQLDMLLLLESELGWVDELLIDRPEDIELWQQRVSLLDEMQQRYASNTLESQMQQMVL